MDNKRNETVQTLKEMGLLSADGTIDWAAYSKLPCRSAPKGLVGKVFGDDTRVLVADPSIQPFHSVVCLAMTFGGELFRGTGFITGANAVTTAGHNLYDHAIAKLAEKVVIFARQENYPDEMAEAISMFVTSAFTKSYSEKEDWGIISMNNPLGVKTGLMACAKGGTGHVGAAAVITGFPGEVSGVPNNKNMYTAIGPLDSYDAGKLLFHYKTSSSGGNSGSPLYVNTDAGVRALAIHIGGNDTTNYARVIDDFLLGEIEKYKA